MSVLHHRTTNIMLAVLVLAAGIMAWATNELCLNEKYRWSEDFMSMPLLSTRFNFRGGVVTRGHSRYDYSTYGNIPGLTPGTEAPDDLLIIVHGFNNDDDRARNACSMARDSLRLNGFNGAILGMSWDADTQLDPFKMIGFHEGRAHAMGNGPKLAKFVLDYKRRCPGTRVHVLGYSMGTRVVLEMLRAFEEDPVLSETECIVDSVHLVGASVDNEEVQTNHEYGVAIENRTGTLINYYSIHDRVLGWLYVMKEADRALGETDIENPNFTPRNYMSINVEGELKAFDLSGNIRPERTGLNHMGILGVRDIDGNVLDDGVMDVVAETIRSLYGDQD